MTFWISFCASFITVPLTLESTPPMKPCILLCIFSISSATSSILPVFLLMNSPISFFSIPLANFRNSAVAPLILTSEGVPHLPLPTWIVYFFLSSAAFIASVAFDASPRGLTVDTVFSSVVTSSVFVLVPVFLSLFVVSAVPATTPPPSPCFFGL